MKRGLAVSVCCLLLAVSAAVATGAEDLRKKAEAQWEGREDPAIANEALAAFEALLKQSMRDRDEIQTELDDIYKTLDELKK